MDRPSVLDLIFGLVAVATDGAQVDFAPTLNFVGANVQTDAANKRINIDAIGRGLRDILASGFRFTTDDSKSRVVTLQPKTTTTLNATPKTLDSFELTTGRSAIWSVVVLAQRADGSLAGAYARTAAFRNMNDVVHQIGATQDGLTLADDPGWEVQIDRLGTEVRCRVTGDEGAIRWAVVSERLEVTY